MEIIIMKIKISRSQWEKIGKAAGWIKEAQDKSDKHKQFMDSLDNDNPAKIKPVINLVINLITKNSILVPQTFFDKVKLVEILGQYEFNRYPASVKSIVKKLQKNTGNTGEYDLLIDGKSVEAYIANFINNSHLPSS